VRANSNSNSNSKVEWDYRKLATHIPWNIIKEWVDGMDSSMMCNPSITWKLARLHGHGHGLENEFSGNPNVTRDLVSSNPAVNWTHSCLPTLGT
jgi:hypothetical protein